MTAAPSIALHGVDNIGIAVRDVDRVAGFFANTFGFEIDPLPNGAGTRVRLGDHALALFAAEPDTPHATSAPGMRPGFDHVSIRVDDVDTLYADVRLSSVPWLSEPESLPEWELRVLGFLDPEGNLFYFVSQLDDPGVPRSMSIGS